MKLQPQAAKSHDKTLPDLVPKKRRKGQKASAIELETWAPRSEETEKNQEQIQKWSFFLCRLKTGSRNYLWN